MPLYDAYSSLFYIIPPVIGFFVMMSLALVSLLRARRNPTNILFAIICFLGGIINIDTALVTVMRNEPGILWFDRGVHFLFVFIAPVYIQFVHSFLNISGRRWLPGLAYSCCVFLLIFIPTDLYFSGYHEYSFGIIAAAGPVFHVFSMVIGATVAYCLIALYRAMKLEKDNQKRNRIKYILGGMGLSSILLLFNILPVSGYPIYPLGNFSFIPAVFLAFGVLKYDLLDMGVVIRKGTIYFILTGILTMMYVLIIYVSNILFMGSDHKHSFVLPFILALLIVLIFNPLKTKIRKFIDRLFFRGRYDYRQILREMSGQMASLLKFHQIKDLILDSISDALKVSRVCLIVYDYQKRSGTLYLKDSRHGRYTEEKDDKLFQSRHPIFNYLESRKEPLSKAAIDHEFFHPVDRKSVWDYFESLNATLVIPMIYKDQLMGILAMGQKKSDELFVQEDLELLVTVANQSVTAMENARIYEELECFNQDLEKKVQERTSALRQALAEKERTQQQLIQSESLAAIGQLVAGTAHELNNPLASASSLIQTSIESFNGDQMKDADLAEMKDDLQYALKEIKRAGGIVRSLLDLSRQTNDFIESVNLNAVIEDSLRVLFNQYKYMNVDILKEYEEYLPNVEGNFAGLGQVFINIIQNALQAMTDGTGRISLKTQYDKIKHCVVVECLDTGAGIADQHLKDVYKPFFTTKSVGQGTGLGLYICHEIIKKHAGSINITSKTGRGTLVAVEIPCKRSDA